MLHIWWSVLPKGFLQHQFCYRKICFWQNDKKKLHHTVLIRYHIWFSNSYDTRIPSHPPQKIKKQSKTKNKQTKKQKQNKHNKNSESNMIHASHKPAVALGVKNKMRRCLYICCQVFNIRRTKSQHLKDYRVVLRLSLPNPLKPDVKSRMKMYSWSSADRRCSNYIWVIDNYIAYEGAPYIRGFTVAGLWSRNYLTGRSRFHKMI